MAIQFFNNVQILQPSGTGLLLKSNDGSNSPVNLITQGLGTFGHREILKSGFTGGFASDNNHGHKLFNINQIEQAADGDIKNLQFVQERYLAQEASSLPNSRNAFWAFHKVSKELDELNSSNEVLPNNKTSLSWYAKTQFLYPRTNNDTILVTWNASHGLKQNDHVVVVTDGRGDLVAQQDGWVLDPDPNDNGQSAVIVYGQRTLEYDLASFTSFGSTGWSIHKGSLDPFHNDTIGDTLLNFDADADGNYEAFQLGPGCQTDGNCISIGKNIYNNDAETVKIGYENETLIVKKTGGIEVYGLGQFNNDVLITGALKDSSNNPGLQGQVLSSTVTGTDWIDQGDVIAGEADKAKSVILRVKNSTGSPMSKGQVVCEAVSATPPSGNLIEVALADNNGTNTMPALGILNEDLDAAGGANDEGDAIMFGKVSGINTSAFSVGNEVFVDDTPGGLTTTKPTGVKYIQKVGVVIRDDANNGTIEVFGAGRVNDVPTPLYVDHANQRLGIGVTNPGYRLEVNGTSFFTGDVTIGELQSPGDLILPTPGSNLDIGENTLTGADNSIALGSNNTVSAAYAIAMGQSNNVTGNEGIAGGFGNTVSGLQAQAFGLNNTASAAHTTAFGVGTTASQINALAAGDSTTANAVNAVAFGLNTNVSGGNSLAIGLRTNVSGFNSFGGGRDIVLSGNRSIASGDDVNVSGSESIAVGQILTCASDSSIVVGTRNDISAGSENVAVFGENNDGLASNTLTAGNGLQNNSPASLAVGVWNVQRTNSRFAVGIGLDNNQREDAFVIDNTGTIIAYVLQKSTSNYANDAAAAAGGVPVGGLYRNGSVVQIRVS